MKHPTRALILATLTLLFAACGGSTEPEQGVTEPTPQEAADSDRFSTKKPVAVIEESGGRKNFSRRQ